MDHLISTHLQHDSAIRRARALRRAAEDAFFKAIARRLRGLLHAPRSEQG